MIPSRHSYASQSVVSDQIRQEIQRFESVHPCIYAIYDLVDLIPDPMVAQQIRDHVVCIEDSFVNSQEWTLSRAAPILKLGLLGIGASGKSALVHRYLTGSYMQEESPEGGRFKKEVLIDGQSYLLLIRDEGGPPEQQFTHWVDAVIFVFSLESEASFNAIYNFYAKMAHHRNTADIPLILVGTQDAICANNPRVVEDGRARRLANDLKRCGYYETCATYGLNVEKVFREACQKIIAQKQSGLSSCPSTPSHTSSTSSIQKFYFPQQQQQTQSSSSLMFTQPSSGHQHHLSPPVPTVSFPTASQGSRDSQGSRMDSQGFAVPQAPNSPTPKRTSGSVSTSSLTPSPSGHTPSYTNSAFSPVNNVANGQKTNIPQSSSALFNETVTVRGSGSSGGSDLQADGNQQPTPSSTPTATRKNNRRISNIFRKDDEKTKHSSNGEVGSGRAIPVKQGHLYKKSVKSLNKEWKKKYVALYDNGRLSYHSTLRDYMDDCHGKEIYLGHTTVKVPGQPKPRGSKAQPISNGILNKDNVALRFAHGKDKENEKVQLMGFEAIHEGRSHNFGDSNLLTPNLPFDDKNSPSQLETPNTKKKRHARKTSGGKNADLDDNESFEFVIVSIDNQQWHFEASSVEERDEWVQAIEAQILSSLQGNESRKAKAGSRAHGDSTLLLALRQVNGNGVCADCGTQNPDWVSLNLGAMICIECSGIHRNLGTHISKVRSLDLDEWPLAYISVLQHLGNKMVNSLWEFNTRNRSKPSHNSPREIKETWIRAKYETKEFLAPLPAGPGLPLIQQLRDAIVNNDLKSVLLVLAHGQPGLVNCHVETKDQRSPLHVACLAGHPQIAQLLIWYNADVSAVDHNGQTPLYYARQSGCKNCQEILQHSGCLAESKEIPNGSSKPTSLSSNRRSNPNGSSCDVFENLPASVI